MAFFSRANELMNGLFNNGNQLNGLFNNGDQLNGLFNNDDQELVVSDNVVQPEVKKDKGVFMDTLVNTSYKEAISGTYTLVLSKARSNNVDVRVLAKFHTYIIFCVSECLSKFLPNIKYDIKLVFYPREADVIKEHKDSIFPIEDKHYSILNQDIESIIEYATDIIYKNINNILTKVIRKNPYEISTIRDLVKATIYTLDKEKIVIEVDKLW